MKKKLIVIVFLVLAIATIAFIVLCAQAEQRELSQVDDIGIATAMLKGMVPINIFLALLMEAGLFCDTWYFVLSSAPKRRIKTDLHVLSTCLAVIHLGCIIMITVGHAPFSYMALEYIWLFSFVGFVLVKLINICIPSHQKEIVHGDHAT